MNRFIRCFSSIGDPYKILGIPHGSNRAEVKLAYFKLAKKFHPDVNPTPEAKLKFQQLSEAWEKLSTVHDESEEALSNFQTLQNALPSHISLEKYQHLVKLYFKNDRDLSWALNTIIHRIELERFENFASYYPKNMEWKLRFYSKKISKYLKVTEEENSKYTEEWARERMKPYLHDIQEKLSVLKDKTPAIVHPLFDVHHKQLSAYLLGEISADKTLELWAPIFDQFLAKTRLEQLKKHFPGKERAINFNIHKIERYLTNPDKFSFDWAVKQVEKFI